MSSIQSGFSSSVLFFDGRKWVVQFDKFGAGIANTPDPHVKDYIEPMKAVYASSPEKVYAVTGQAVVINDRNEWHIRKAPNEFYSALSGFENKVVGVGWLQEHNNLTNRTIYQAAVFNLP